MKGEDKREKTMCKREKKKKKKKKKEKRKRRKTKDNGGARPTSEQYINSKVFLDTAAICRLGTSQLCRVSRKYGEKTFRKSSMRVPRRITPIFTKQTTLLTTLLNAR
ncbi:hypothetical protein HZH66_006133 [Vespula vulgaris]|uniref:Uncharacterized protein n=1 Tax=Vespula vulgaris TaxID=7454 RepID=A0A834K9T6_VESVU|nr:hypothetical protein HZH66_006133 [Vespula vulgaris]